MSYTAETKRGGRLKSVLTFQPEWFDRPEQIVRAAEALEFDPDRIVVHSKEQIAPKALIPGLTARGFAIVAESDQKVEARAAGLSVAITDASISFSGVSLEQFLGVDDFDGKAIATPAAVLQLL